MKLLFQLILVISLAPVSTSLFSQPVIIDVTTTPADCNGSATGTVTFSITGGAKPYYYYIIKGGVPRSSPQTSDTVYTFTDVSAGTYLCIVEDNNSMNDFRNRTVSQPPPIQITSVILTPISCTGFADGKINVTASGESGSYNFLLKPDGLSTITGSFEDRSPGNYRVVVSDATGCLSKDSTDILTFTDPDPISITSENKTNITCNGANNGTITIGASGGTGTYTYIISPGGTSNQTGHFTDLGPNTYTVEVTDGNTCPSATSIPLTITQPDPLQYTLQTSTNASCSGVNDGTITVAASGGTTPYRFTLSPGGTFNEDGLFTGLAPGNYTISLTDANSCGPVASIPFNITQPGPITITGTTFSDITCFNFNNGEIHVTASGGNAPLTYTLNPGADSRPDGDFTGLSEGSYTITVTDTKGCAPAVTPAINIVNPPDITLNPPALTHITCNGAANGIISVTANGGTGTLHYTLNPTAITNTSGTFAGRSPGDYTVSVTDDNTCPQKTTGTLTITQPDPLEASTDGSSKLSVSCYGDKNGSVYINVTGGTTPYTYSWTGPDGFTSPDKDITGLAPGEYNLSITDANSCIASYTPMATITEPDPLQMSLAKTDVVCNGQGNGTITVTASGGTPPYQYSRNGITYQASNIFNNLSKNTYTVYVRDNNSCIKTDVITIDEPDKLLITSEIRIDGNLCHGDTMGEIRILNVNGGVTPYQYSIDGGLTWSSSPIFNNLPAGSYQTVVKDFNECMATGNLNNISQPSPIRIDDYAQTDVTVCYTSLNGQIVIEASGGTGSKSYSLDEGIPNTTGIFTGVSGGNHTITISDENNCINDTVVYINHPAPLIFTSFTVTDVTGCTGDSTGAVSAVASGGTGSIVYRINGGTFQADSTFTGLAAGNHTLTIMDDNNCIKDSIFNISEPDPLVISSLTKEDISCSGDDNGTITVIAAGGTSPYTFTLNPSAEFNNDGLFTALAQGTYTVSITDNEGCGPVESSPVTINEPALLSIDSVRWTDISCTGDANGTISIYASGGTPTFTYSIDNGVSFLPGSDFSNIGPGTYTPLVKDNSACEAVDAPVVLTDPAPLTPVAEASTDVTDCFGNLNGSLAYEVSGGTGAIQYSYDGISWQADGIFTGMGGGTYIVTAKDANNCTLNSGEVTINQPDQITATITGTPWYNEFKQGSITISNVAGGTGSYEFSINGMAGPFTSQTSYTGLEAGIYDVIVRDGNNCTYIQPVTISSVPSLDVTLSITASTCNGYDDAVILITVNDATGPVEYSIDDSLTWHANNEFAGLAPGTYYIAVKEESGRYFTDIVSVYEPLPLDILSDITSATCNRYSPDGEVIITVTGGTGTMSYQWADGPVTKDRSGLDAGSYTLTVTDQNGCETTEIITMPAKTNVTASAGADTIVCEGSTIILDGQGGSIFSWSPAEGLSNPGIPNPAVTVTSEVSYILTAVGTNDCYDTDTITIGIYPKLGLSAGNDTTVIKNNPVNLNATGGPYVSYQWNPATGLDNTITPDPVAAPPASQTYVVTAVDEHGCVENDTVTITIIENIVIYSSFSPNDDGINDFWDIDNAEYYPDILVEVFNRWGEKLFSSKGYTAGKRWDGYHKGKKVPIGTYYYVVIPYKGASALTGPLTIIR